MNVKEEKPRKEIEIVVDKVIAEAERIYTEEHGVGNWEELSKEEKFDLACEVLEKYYNPEKKGYIIP